MASFASPGEAGADHLRGTEPNPLLTHHEGPIYGRLWGPALAPGKAEG